ncbi:hypothetical protein [Burkholderia ambifaria]|uniref:hypothetical protein n=1 Tax=Burkholderia ambifaria TaxID=152480 RepID=UPI00158E4394|nr:hypothetical protein [Burkholderia ambifaria]
MERLSGNPDLTDSDERGRYGTVVPSAVGSTTRFDATVAPPVLSQWFEAVEVALIMGANGAAKCAFIEVRSGIQELDGGTLVRWLGSTGFSVPRALRWFVSLSK